MRIDKWSIWNPEDTSVYSIYNDTNGLCISGLQPSVFRRRDPEEEGPVPDWLLPGVNNHAHFTGNVFIPGVNNHAHLTGNVLIWI